MIEVQVLPADYYEHACCLTCTFLCAVSAMCLHLGFPHNSYYTLPYLEKLLPYYTGAYSFTSVVDQRIFILHFHSFFRSGGIKPATTVGLPEY